MAGEGFCGGGDDDDEGCCDEKKGLSCIDPEDDVGAGDSVGVDSGGKPVESNEDDKSGTSGNVGRGRSPLDIWYKVDGETSE